MTKKDSCMHYLRFTPHSSIHIRSISPRFEGSLSVTLFFNFFHIFPFWFKVRLAGPFENSDTVPVGPLRRLSWCVFRVVVLLKQLTSSRAESSGGVTKMIYAQQYFWAFIIPLWCEYLLCGGWKVTLILPPPYFTFGLCSLACRRGLILAKHMIVIVAKEFNFFLIWPQNSVEILIFFA